MTMTETQAAPKTTTAAASDPVAKIARNAVIDRVVAHTMSKGMNKSPDTADLIMSDLRRLGFGELMPHALPAIRALQRLASTEWLTTPTGDDARDQAAETRARMELARVTLSGMGVPWRRRST